MDIELALRILQSAGGDPALLCLTAVDLAFPERTAIERARLKEALQVAAIPHWFDGPILAALLEASMDEGQKLAADLSRLSIVESFIARGAKAQNVHEKSRLALRRHAFIRNSVRFGALSVIAATRFESSDLPQNRIEWIYHRLCSGIESVAEELEEIDQDFVGKARPEDRLALAGALQELEDAQMLSGCSRAMSLISIGFVRNGRGESSQLIEIANNALEVARASDRPSLIGQALCLKGDIAQTSGDFSTAFDSYKQCLSVFEDLAQSESNNTRWLRGISVAKSKIGDVLEILGDRKLALKFFEESMAASSHLSNLDPENVAWQQHLAASHCQIGDHFKSQNNTELALQAYGKALSILQHLTSLDPLNLSWQLDLGNILSNVSGILQRRGRYDQALPVAQQTMAITTKLVETDPTDRNWQHALSAAHGLIGSILEDQGKLDLAYRAYKEGVSIVKSIVELDPDNTEWQRDLGVGYARLGGALKSQGKFEDARVFFEQRLVISQHLVKLAPDHEDWNHGLALAYAWVGELDAAKGHMKAARECFRNAINLLKILVERNPSVSVWKEELKGMRRTHARISIGRFK